MQLPVMEDYMQGKSIQDDKKKFIAEMQCNKDADQNKLWMKARDRVDADGLYYGFMECVKAAEGSRRRATRKQVNHCTTHSLPPLTTLVLHVLQCLLPTIGAYEAAEKAAKHKKIVEMRNAGQSTKANEALDSFVWCMQAGGLVMRIK